MRAVHFIGFLIVACIVATGCNNTATAPTAKTDTVAALGQHTDSTQAIGDAAEATDADYFRDYYVTIADTGRDYRALDRAMYGIAGRLNVKIDTMGRYYNEEDEHIVLPDTIEDEMYRGGYYPRREGDDYLSIEYTAMFDTTASQDNMCVVAGLFTTRKSADSALRRLQPIVPKAFVVKAKVYEGCLH